MNSEYERIPNKTRTLINNLEEQHDMQLSTIQKILCSIEGPIVSILDVLYGDVGLFMLDQHMEKADKDIAEKLDLNEGDEVDRREVIIHKHGRPLTYGLSYIPKDRCSNTVIEKLLKEELTTGRIMAEHEIESLTKINNITLEKPSSKLQELFHTDEYMLEREFVLIHKKNVVIWSKEAYPISYFNEKVGK